MNHQAHDLLPVLHRELERVGLGDAPLLNPLQGEGSEDLTVRLDEPEAGFAYEQVELSLDVACECVTKRGNSGVSEGSSSGRFRWTGPFPSDGTNGERRGRRV